MHRTCLCIKKNCDHLDHFMIFIFCDHYSLLCKVRFRWMEVFVVEMILNLGTSESGINTDLRRAATSSVQIALPIVILYYEKNSGITCLMFVVRFSSNILYSIVHFFVHIMLYIIYMYSTCFHYVISSFLYISYF